MLDPIINAGRPVEKILARLEGVRRSGRGWVARCPAHLDRSPSLSIAEGHDGRVLIHCFAGCSLEAILSALGLETKDLFPEASDAWRWTRAPRLPAPHPKPTPKPDEGIRVRLEKLWAQAAPIDRPRGELGRRYLEARGIPLSVLPATPLLRLHPGLPYRDGEVVVGTFPTLLARVEHPAHGLVAIHRTYLAHDGSGKAPIPSPKKLTRPVFEGGTKGAGIRLFPLEGPEVAVAEGIETALAIAAITHLPVCAAVSAGGLEAWIPPPWARRVLIGADADEAGRKAAIALAKRLLSTGINVRIAIPDEGDWLDELQKASGRVAAHPEHERGGEHAPRV